jgi:hypothetical protein
VRGGAYRKASRRSIIHSEVSSAELGSDADSGGSDAAAFVGPFCLAKNRIFLLFERGEVRGGEA